ncbi:MAG: FAD:protein FMN transferase [Bacilli bacterium]|nr:FAD:protein FMN transferase [Bacilli bacterium]
MKYKVTLLLLVGLLTSCSINYEVTTNQVANLVVDGEIVIPFAAPMSLTLYQKGEMDEYYPAYNSLMQTLHKEADRYHNYPGINNLKTINDSYGSGEAIVINSDLYNLLEQALSLSELTDGYFNPTIGTLSDYWSPIINGEVSEINDNKVQSALTCVSSVAELRNVIKLDKATSSVTFNTIPGCEGKGVISLGGIAKGYALDVAASLFSDTNVLLDGGRSSMRTLGTNPNPKRDTWNIAILSPYNTNLGVLALKGDLAFSTSGDYEQAVVINGVRYHHIINPYTGYSENYYRSISLYSTGNATVLDALSTALFNVGGLGDLQSIISHVEKYYGIKIEVLLEQEVEDEKLNIYATNTFYGAMLDSEWSNSINHLYVLGE